MEHEPGFPPLTFHIPGYVYLVQNHEKSPNSTFTRTRSAHAEKAGAEIEAEFIANQDRCLEGAEQNLCWTYLDYQKCWRTTYQIGRWNLWRMVSIHKVPFVVNEPDLSREAAREVHETARLRQPTQV